MDRRKAAGAKAPGRTSLEAALAEAAAAPRKAPPEPRPRRLPLPKGASDAERARAALRAYAALHPHPSGWVRHDDRAIRALSGLGPERLAAAERAIGLRMRVSGSREPTLTYEPPEAAEEGKP
jgi:hypothetical protein